MNLLILGCLAAFFGRILSCQIHHELSKLDEWNSNAGGGVANRPPANTDFQVINRFFDAQHKWFNVTLSHFGIDESKPDVGYIYSPGL
jgi:hypothetical protein